MVDRHTGRRLSRPADRHDLGLQAVLLLDEVRRPPHADVPRRGMDGEAGAVGDVLPRHVLDVALRACTMYGTPASASVVELERPLACRRQLRFFAPRPDRGPGGRRLPRRRRTPSDPSGTSRVTAAGASHSGDRVNVHFTGRAPIGAPNRYRAVTLPLQRIAGDRPIAGQRDVDAEIRTTVGGDQERPVDDLVVRHVVVGSRPGRLARAAAARASAASACRSRASRARE